MHGKYTHRVLLTSLSGSTRGGTRAPSLPNLELWHICGTSSADSQSHKFMMGTKSFHSMTISTVSVTWPLLAWLTQGNNIFWKWKGSGENNWLILSMCMVHNGIIDIWFLVYLIFCIIFIDILNISIFVMYWNVCCTYDTIKAWQWFWFGEHFHVFSVMIMLQNWSSTRNGSLFCTKLCNFTAITKHTCQPIIFGQPCMNWVCY